MDTAGILSKEISVFSLATMIFFSASVSDLTYLKNLFNIFNLVPRFLSYSSSGVGEDPGNEVDFILA